MSFKHKVARDISANVKRKARRVVGRKYYRRVKRAHFGDITIRESSHRDWLSSDEYHLMVEYTGFSREVDVQLRKIVGQLSAGSGFWLHGPSAGIRDHDWWFTSRAKALSAAKRLKKAKLTIAGDPWKKEKPKPVRLRVRLVGELLL